MGFPLPAPSVLTSCDRSRPPAHRLALAVRPRLDRIAALVLGKDLERGGLGRFQCIIAAAFPGAPRADRGSPGVGERGRDRLPSLSLQAFLLNLANNVAPMCSAGHPVVGAVVL